jgi:UDP-GlcNAc:undecaprenyl-phosphate GlcNAc-1-phosphate transferase
VSAIGDVSLTYLVALFVFLLSSILSASFTPLARIFGVKFGIMDVPGRLAIHSKPTPRVGGLAVYVAFLVAVLLPGVLGKLGNDAFVRSLVVVSAGAGFGLVGLLGDMAKVPSKVEFGLQFLPAMLVVAFGVRVGFIPIPFIDVPLTLFYLVGGACSMNLLDGMDGLAAGVAVISSGFFALVGLLQGNDVVTILALALAGSSLGFLLHNFHPAKVFMGDIGSLFLGFTLSTMAVLTTSRPYDVTSFVSPILILGVPILDTLVAILRRISSGREIISGDRSHLYDLLLDKGLPVEVVALVMYALALVLGFVGLWGLRASGVVSILLLSLAAFLVLASAFGLGAFDKGSAEDD